MPVDPDQLVTLTADIVAAHVANNSVATTDLPGLIRQTYDALASLGAPPVAAPEPEHQPAVTARKSLADPDRIVSMIDGKPYSSLKRHIGSHGLTPDQYRARYKLPASYPMVAPGYSAKRKALSLQLGLGRKKAAAPADAEPKPATMPSDDGPEPKRRGRKPKAIGAAAGGEQKARKPRQSKTVGTGQPNDAANTSPSDGAAEG